MKIRHLWFSAHRLPFNALFIHYFGHSGAIENHHKDGRITICNNALREAIDEQIVILESLKTHPGSNERNFENLIVTVEAPNPMQPFWIFCCNLFPFVATFLFLKRKILMLQSKFMTTIWGILRRAWITLPQQNEYILKERFEGILT